ncbi:MAG: DMT family transporter [Methyloceanibacter sp.]|jgi:drug/metabolite transporter (DMT)-like permease
MISALLGLTSALGLGTADFMARFSARALGAAPTYAVVLLIGSVATTIWVVVSGAELVWSPYGCAIAVAHGMSVSVMCILLYEGMARGPIAVVAPIVASHPVPVLIVNVLMGVRPSAVQWGAMAVVILGGVLISRHAISDAEPSQAKANRTTILIALGACLAYVAIVLTAQTATPLIGELQTMWIGRWAGLVFIALILAIQRAPVRVPRSWWPFVGLQGALDSLGYLAFLAGANSASPHVTMVVASAFSVVTVLLARVVINEQISRLQWFAIALIAAGTAILSGT